jgi:hypothetical protein
MIVVTWHASRMGDGNESSTLIPFAATFTVRVYRRVHVSSDHGQSKHFRFERMDRMVDCPNLCPREVAGDTEDVGGLELEYEGNPQMCTDM